MGPDAPMGGAAAAGVFAAVLLGRRARAD